MGDSDKLEAEVKTLAINLESYKRDNDKCNEDTQVHLNDVSEQLDTIQNNHLAHLKTDVACLSAKLVALKDQISLLLKVIGWGLAALALLIGVPTIIALLWQVFND